MEEKSTAKFSCLRDHQVSEDVYCFIFLLLGEILELNGEKIKGIFPLDHHESGQAHSTTVCIFLVNRKNDRLKKKVQNYGGQEFNQKKRHFSPTICERGSSNSFFPHSNKL